MQNVIQREREEEEEEERSCTNPCDKQVLEVSGSRDNKDE